MMSKRCLPGLGLVAMAAGCAVFDGDNRRTLDLLDRHVAPQSAAGRWLLSPVAVPIGVAAGAVDAALVHPLCVIDDAWGDTAELLWEPRKRDTGFRRAVFAPLAGLATPPVFAFDWLMRSLFAIPPRRRASADEAADR